MKKDIERYISLIQRKKTLNTAESNILASWHYQKGDGAKAIKLIKACTKKDSKSYELLSDILLTSAQYDDYEELVPNEYLPKLQLRAPIFRDSKINDLIENFDRDVYRSALFLLSLSFDELKVHALKRLNHSEFLVKALRIVFEIKQEDIFIDHLIDSLIGRRLGNEAATIISRIESDETRAYSEAKFASFNGEYKQAYDKYLDLYVKTKKERYEIRRLAIYDRVFSDNDISSLEQEVKRSSIPEENRLLQNILAENYIKNGEGDKAKALLIKLLTDKNIHSSSYSKLAQLMSNAELDKYRPIFESPEYNDPQFGFGKYYLYNSLGLYGDAFNALVRANNFVDALSSANTNEIESYFNFSKSITTKIKTQEAGSKYIFIMGMPRSGTTLLENILIRSESITSLGETKYLLDKIEQQVANKKLILSEVQQDYLDKTGRQKTKEEYVIEKLPHNYTIAGIISRIFPESKILILLRNPESTIWSNYTTQFASGNEFSYSIEKLVKVYNMFLKYVDHWSNTIENLRIVRYELLVRDPQIYSQIFDFLDLEFDQRFLEIEKNRQKVSTASEISIRKGILKDRDSVFTNYANFIDVGSSLDTRLYDSCVNNVKTLY